MWILPWIKLSWHSCSVWDKLGWLNWFWQFLCVGLSSFTLKECYYSYAWSSSLREGKTAFCTGLTSRKFCNLLFAFSTGFTSRSVLLLFPLLITFFIIINSLLMLFRLTQMMFSRSSHLLLCMSFETLTSMITYSGGTDGHGKLL